MDARKIAFGGDLCAFQLYEALLTHLCPTFRTSPSESTVIPSISWIVSRKLSNKSIHVDSPAAKSCEKFTR